MAKALLLSQLKSSVSRCCGYAPMVTMTTTTTTNNKQPGYFEEYRAGFRSLSTANGVSRRKRGRSEQTLVSSVRRQFSNSPATKSNAGNFERQLDELLESLPSQKYQNVWKLPRGDTPEKTSSLSSSSSPSSSSSSKPSSPHYLHPLDSDKIQDRESRHLLDLLQTLQEVGLTNTSDRVTTKRCNRILKDLAATLPKTKRKPSVASVIDHWQRIERAKAIVESMESYLEQQNASFSSPIPMDLPVPSHDTYFWILKLYSSAQQLSEQDFESAKSKTEYAVYDITLLEAATEAPLAVRAIVEQLQKSDNLGLQPTSLHWNQVLSCYANALRRPNRPLEAATLLYELSANDNNNNNNSTATIDASSFAHVLRACADSTALEDYYDFHKAATPNANSEFWAKKETFAKLALGVAERVWKGLQQEQEKTSKTQDIPNGILMNSHHLVHMLKAGRNVATHLCIDSNQQLQQQQQKWLKEHEEWMRSIWQEGCRHQMVNIHVLQEILYQGAVVLQNSNGDDYLEWIERIVLPKQNDDSIDLARFRSRWKTEILPSLVESRNKNAVDSNSKLESFYASTIHQTRILMRSLPSRWKAKAD